MSELFHQRSLTLSERLILRAWLREVEAMRPVGGDGTEYRMRRVAESCGVSVGRVANLIRRTPYVEREACRA